MERNGRNLLISTKQGALPPSRTTDVSSYEPKVLRSAESSVTSC